MGRSPVNSPTRGLLVNRGLITPGGHRGTQLTSSSPAAREPLLEVSAAGHFAHRGNERAVGGLEHGYGRRLDPTRRVDDGGKEDAPSDASPQERFRILHVRMRDQLRALLHHVGLRVERNDAALYLRALLLQHPRQRRVPRGEARRLEVRGQHHDLSKCVGRR